MLDWKFFLYCMFLQLIFGKQQLNLYYTNENGCIRIEDISDSAYKTDHAITYYCLSELPSQWKIQHVSTKSKLTFAELKKKKITSEQLYLWSAPIDLIEDYQSNTKANSSEYWNCTWPRFGPQCQYQFYQSVNNQLNLDLQNFIKQFYTQSSHIRTNLTCYIHLKCTRNSLSVCLQWREICDGEVQCVDTGIDEKDCWQFEINECQADEYRCRNGQCIPKIFFQNAPSSTPNCLDGTDEFTDGRLPMKIPRGMCPRLYMPSFICEDITCEHLPFAKFCLHDPINVIINAFSSNTNTNSNSNRCVSAVKCLILLSHLMNIECHHSCLNYTCIKMINESCPNWIVLEFDTDQFGDIHFVFQPTMMISPDNVGLLYICYRNSFYDAFFPLNPYVMFNESKCLFHEIINDRVNQIYSEGNPLDGPIDKLYNKLRRFYMISNMNLKLCEQPNVYQCRNSSKCISIYRINDGVQNCPLMDDENMIDIENINIINRLNKNNYYKCGTLNKYIHPNLLINKKCDCEHIDNVWCEDEEFEMDSSRTKISFQTICDGLQELSAKFLDENNHTDETECQQWECNNLYTRCNGFWNCPNGDDEAGCPSKFQLQCSSKEHYCVSLKAPYQLTCLPIERINDKQIDCLGGTDEISLCQRYHGNLYTSSFYCDHMCIDSLKLCDGHKDCSNGDDELVCILNQTVCSIHQRADRERFLCNQFKLTQKLDIVLFKLDYDNNNFHVSDNRITQFSQIQTQTYNPHDIRCHRGIDLLVWLNFDKQLSTRTCLCPSSFYGPLCQYQNQRVTTTVRFRALSDSWQTLFTIIVSLIDDSHQRIVHSYEQLTFLWQIHCEMSFHFYLLYSTQPKDTSKNYSIQIDFYEKDSLKYRGSSLYPIEFAFLPVHRVAILAEIPPTDNQNQTCSDRICIHGKCIRYYNDLQGRTFCHCDERWTGDDCSIPYNCTCSSTSHCHGILPSNRSICVCPTTQFGPRCFINRTMCQNQGNNSTCLHNGTCITLEGLASSKHHPSFACVCSNGYTGERCEISLDTISISIDRNIISSQLIYIHLISVFDFVPLQRATTFQTIHSHQDLIVVNVLQHVSLIFIEFFEKKYYLTDFRDDSKLNTTVTMSDHCPNISELFNQTFIQWSLIRRVKYYHLPCQNLSLNIKCFHDDVHLCLCYSFHGKRLANCFEFDHELKFDCDGRSECGEGSQCFQDDKTCPKRSICYCKECFYGRRCQFTTSGFGLSLDAILGYRIEPNVNLSQQSAIVKFSLILTIISVLGGLVDGFLSLITFKNKPIRDVGCGIYLLCSSITTIFISLVLLLKFSILLGAQMNNISNRIFLQIQCHLLDFLLRICLQLDQWLTACVAVERTFTVIKETRFDKRTSRQCAKYVVICLLIILIGSSVQDPLHRHLIDERNDDTDQIKRTWCTITFSSNIIRQFNSYMHTFHFLLPFTINFVSAIILIRVKSRQHLRTHKNQSYKQILRQQYKQHKHLLVAPIISVLLALPRLILTFLSRCMQSSDDAWLFIILYFISFIPCMLTFIIFVLPSKFYRKEFSKSILKYRIAIQRYFNR